MLLLGEMAGAGVCILSVWRHIERACAIPREILVQTDKEEEGPEVLEKKQDQISCLPAR